ncbi:MAG: sulfotransferase family protein [Parvibaculaceae bacterium]
MWSPAPKSAEALALYAAADADRAANPVRYQLDPELITAAAFAKTPLDEKDSGDWKEGLEVYLNAARNEGHLNALGLRNVAASATGRLIGRASLARALGQTPEVSTRKIDRPIFIIGGWRTGTTLLQRLLSALPGLRALYPAELTVPWRFAGMDKPTRDAALAAGEGAHQRLHVLNPAMWSIHPSGARLAEECVLAMGSDMHNWGFTSTLRCPTYADWLLQQDFTGSYHRYSNILRLLQDNSPDRWILKAPAHTAELRALLAAFPDAHVVHLHRDVVQTVTSGASLFAVFRSTYSDHVDAAELGRYQLDMTQTWFDRAMQARDNHRHASFTDVAFTDLARDPVATAKVVCAACDIAWTDATETAAQARLTDLSKQHGAHKYAPEDFGLDADEIRSRFTAYTSRFGVS